VIVTISYRQLAEQNKDLPQKKAWENDHCDAKKFVARIWLSCYTRSFFL
jgi:hypothetical protein